MITFTEEPDIHLSSIITENNFKAIKLSVKGGGCSGFTYDWQPMENLDVGTEDIILDLESGHL